MAKAHELGLMLISKARRLDEEESRLEKWLKDEMHGDALHGGSFQKRLDPRKLVPVRKTVVSLCTIITIPI